MKKIITLLIVLATFAANVNATVRYVKPSASGNGSGDSWTNASGDLQETINTSNSGDTIWVAAGKYLPNRPANDLTNIDASNRDNAFVLKEGVKIYGGFAGTEDNRDARKWATNKTILSGDIDGISGINTGDAYHVVIGADITNAVLDGFTITGGNANGIGITITVNGQTINHNNGSGIQNVSSSPTLTNLTITGNSAGHGGGGISNLLSSPMLANIAIYDNVAVADGGGIYNYGTSHPTLTNVTISKNSAHRGGGILNNGGEITLQNSIVSGNLLIGDLLTANAPDCWVYTAHPLTLDGTCINAHYSLIGDTTHNDTSSQDITRGVGCIFGPDTGIDPDFTNAANGDYTLQASSPAIDKGNDSLYQTARGLAPSSDVDLAGNPRLFGANIDMGAYENQTPSSPVISINTEPAASTTVTYGSISGSLTVGASATAGATLSYQWYSNTTASSIGGTPITGATDASFTIPTTLAANTYYYYVVVSATGGATDVSSTVATLTVNNADNAGTASISVSNTTETRTNVYLTNCGASEVVIIVTPDKTDSKVIYNGAAVSSIPLDVSHADIYTVDYEIETIAGNKTAYSLQVESRFAFDAIAGMKFNNVLFVNNNFANNGGYNFVSYEWFKNGQAICTGQYYSAGKARSDVLDASAQYSVAMTTDDGKVLHTCEGTILLQSASLQVYPNPALNGESITLKYTAPQIPDHAVISIFNIAGKLIGTQQLTDHETKLSLPSAPGIYLIRVNDETVKVIIE